MARRAAMAAFAMILAGCAGGEEASAPRLASGQELPACKPGSPSRSATAVFVATGRAWAIRPDGTGLTCLFRVPDAGPFEWGPRGDRALLGHLEVRGLAGAPRRNASAQRLIAASWGRPTGKSIVFVGRNGRSLLKAHMGRRALENLSPLGRVDYEDVIYHPSGLAIAFLVRGRGGKESIWMSTNRGERPRRLVGARGHTDLGTIAFSSDGSQLLFSARHADGRSHLHVLTLTSPSRAPAEFRTKQSTQIRRIVPARVTFLALTVGTSCSNETAVLHDRETSRTQRLLRDKRPTRPVGWLGLRTVLVAAGGCGEPLDLYAVEVRRTSVRATLLVRRVSAAATRLAEPFPPPPLPDEPKVPGSGFA